MNVYTLARNVGIKDPDVVHKAEELMRLSRIKIPGGLGPGEVCKAAVCLELACGMCSGVVPPSRDTFIRYGCATKKVYMTAFGLCQKLLDAGSKGPSISSLALKCGCENLVKPAEALLALYRKRFVAQLNNPQSAAPTTSDSSNQQSAKPQAAADFSRPAFAIAALQLTASAQGWKKGQAKLNVRKVLTQLGITMAQYQPVVDGISSLCAAELGLDTDTTDDAATGAGAPSDADAGAARAQSGATAGASDDAEPARPAGKGRARGNAGAGARKQGAAGAKQKKQRKRARRESSEDECESGSDVGGEEGDEEEWEMLGKAGQGEDREGLADVTVTVRTTRARKSAKVA